MIFAIIIFVILAGIAICWQGIRLFKTYSLLCETFEHEDANLTPFILCSLGAILLIAAGAAAAATGLISLIPFIWL